jgi:hypothetical protein
VSIVLRRTIRRIVLCGQMETFKCCYNSIMNSKSLIWIGMLVGSTIGSYLPALWGDSFLSVGSVVLSTVGGLAGIWAGYKASRIF